MDDGFSFHTSSSSNGSQSELVSPFPFKHVPKEDKIFPDSKNLPETSHDSSSENDKTEIVSQTPLKLSPPAPSVSVSSEPTPEPFSEPKLKPIKTSQSRKKVPYEKGFSQMDWMKLSNSHPDLAGRKGMGLRRISMEEVKVHRTEKDAWTVLRGRVYNITPYLKYHPGGVDILMKGAGKDCTTLFNKYHAWVNFEFLLEKCLLGILDVD